MSFKCTATFSSIIFPMQAFVGLVKLYSSLFTTSEKWWLKPFSKMSKYPISMFTKNPKVCRNNQLNAHQVGFPAPTARTHSRWSELWVLMFLASVPCHPVPCLSECEQSRSTADNTLKLSTTSRRLVSLEGPRCGGGNLSCSQCNRQLPCILIGIMYHWLSETISGPNKSQLIHTGQT